MGPDLDTIRLHSRVTSVRNRWDRATHRLAGHPARSYMSWSGGKDSTAVALLAEHHGWPLVRVSHGIDYPEVITYCAALAGERGWDYRVAYGAPLELLDVDAMCEESANSDYAQVVTPVVGAFDGYLTGMRRDESPGRAKHLTATRGRHVYKDGVVATHPVWDWTTLDVLAYLYSRGVDPCPIYARLAALGAPPAAQRVGMVVAGGGVNHGRYVWLRTGWPDLWAEYVARYPALASLG